MIDAGTGWSPGELARGIERIEQGLAALRGQLVSRDVWEESRNVVARELIDLGAEQTRLRRDLDVKVATVEAARVVGNRWALSLAVTALIGVLALLLR